MAIPPIADFDDLELVGLTTPILFSFMGTSCKGTLQVKFELNWALVVWINGSFTVLSFSPTVEIVCPFERGF
jgi:hypothetical protein